MTPMNRFLSLESWIEEAFRNASFFAITSFHTEGGRRIIRKAQTRDWIQARRSSMALQKLNRMCTIYVVSKDNDTVFLPPDIWGNLDRIWGEKNAGTGEKRESVDASGAGRFEDN